MRSRFLALTGLLAIAISSAASAQIQKLTSPAQTIVVQEQDGKTTNIDVAVPLKLSATGAATAIQASSGAGAALTARTGGDGYAVSGEADNIGVFAHNTRQPANNTAYLGARCCAGDFYGNVAVHGTLTKSAGAFRIDHPLDPAGKYLSHSFVESPDMMNVYNGNVTLDRHGRATVQLPSWFEALNGEYRYQLTAIGAPGPNLYIAKEILANRFAIAGGRPGGKVSWQVTGIRHDAYANTHRIPVEEDKPPLERGTYLFPELFAQGPARSAQFARYPTVRPLVADSTDLVTAIPEAPTPEGQPAKVPH